MVPEHDRNEIQSDQRALALAVLRQAQLDLMATHKVDEADRLEATNFVLGTTPPWRRSRDEWCNRAQVEVEQYEKACRAFVEQKSNGGTPNDRTDKQPED